MNEKLYAKLEKELGRSRIDEDVEDVLLTLAEALADKGIMNKVVVCKESYGRAVVEGRGICSEEDGEVNVRILSIKIGRALYEIDDYFL